MHHNTQKIITAIFFLTSLTLAVIVVYTTYLYFEVYTTIRHFNATVSTLKVKVVEGSHIKIETPMTLHNPSEGNLMLMQILESLSLEGTYILRKTHSVQPPIEISPKSTVNITITADVPSHRLQYVTEQMDENWVVYARIFLQAPIVGKFSWQNAWLIPTITKV